MIDCLKDITATGVCKITEYPHILQGSVMIVSDNGKKARCPNWGKGMEVIKFAGNCIYVKASADGKVDIYNEQGALVKHLADAEEFCLFPACDENNIATWTAEKWLDYLSAIFLARGVAFNFNWLPTRENKDVYCCWFDWQNIGDDRVCKQITVSFTEAGTTSAIGLDYNFIAKKQHVSLPSESTIRFLQDKIADTTFIKQADTGGLVTYAHKHAATKEDVDSFVKSDVWR